MKVVECSGSSIDDDNYDGDIVKRPNAAYEMMMTTDKSR